MTTLDEQYKKLCDLHKTDIEAFDVYRKELVEEAINKLPEDRQQKARQNQWKLDNTLRKYKDPVARMNKMIEIFWEGVYEFRDVIKTATAVKKDDS